MKAILLLVSIIFPSQLMPQDVVFDWSKSYGSSTYDTYSSFTLDIEGYIYVTGSFQNTVDFDPGPDFYPITSYDENDIYILKLNPSGDFLWVKTYESSGSDTGMGIEIDLEGNILITGFFENSIGFDPEGIVWHHSNGYEDLFVLKLDSEGEYLWSKSFGGAFPDFGHDILTDSMGNVYTCGNFRANVDFNPGDESYFIYSATTDNNHAYIHKLDADGNFIWVKSNGTLSDNNSYGKKMVLDSQNSLYMVGNFSGTGDFDPSDDIYTITSAGNYDGFVQKFNESGDFVWVKSIGSSSHDNCYTIGIDGDDNLYLGGSFRETIDFNPGVGIYNVSSMAYSDIYVLKLDTLGAFIWAKTFEGMSSEFLRDLDVQDNGTTVLTGTFIDEEGFEMDFDPGPRELYLTNNGWDEVFLIGLDNNGDFLWGKVVGGEGQDSGTEVMSDTLGNIIVIGSFNETADLDPNLDGEALHTSNGINDRFILKLKSCNLDSTTQTVIACDSFLWVNDVIYYESTENEIHTFINESGCDSIVTLNLTVNYSNSIIDERTVCDSLIWIDGITYYEDNMSATYTLLNTEGCDSNITLNLSINTIDPTTTLDDPTINSNEFDAFYQWLDCDHSYMILDGEIWQDFTAETNGNYAVEISKFGCVDTSECVTITSVGLNEDLPINMFTISPNPFNDFSALNFDSPLDYNSFIIIHNVIGQEVYRIENLTGSKLILTKRELGTGVFTLSIITDNTTVFTTKLIVQ